MAAPAEVQQLIPTTSRVDSLKTCLNMEHPLQVKKQACPKLENLSDRPSGIRRVGFRSEQSIAIRRSARGLIESWIAYRAVEIFSPEKKWLLLSKAESWRRRMTRRFLFSRLDSCSTPMRRTLFTLMRYLLNAGIVRDCSMRQRSISRIRRLGTWRSTRSRSRRCADSDAAQTQAGIPGRLR